MCVCEREREGGGGGGGTESGVSRSRVCRVPWRVRVVTMHGVWRVVTCVRECVPCVCRCVRHVCVIVYVCPWVWMSVSPSVSVCVYVWVPQRRVSAAGTLGRSRRRDQEEGGGAGWTLKLAQKSPGSHVGTRRLNGSSFPLLKPKLAHP